MRQPTMPGAIWYSGAGSINEPTPQPIELPPIALELPPIEPEQHNDHVMTYRTWLGWLEAKRNG